MRYVCGGLDTEFSFLLQEVARTMDYEAASGLHLKTWEGTTQRPEENIALPCCNYRECFFFMNSTTIYFMCL